MEEQNQVHIWVKEVFMPDLTDEEVVQFAETLSDYYVRTIDFLESHNIPVTKQSIEQHKAEIEAWTGNSLPENLCNCEQYRRELHKLKSWCLIALAILFLCIIFK